MFVEVQTIIENALREIAEFKTVDVWQGEVEDLLKQTTKLPSCHCIFSTSEFSEPRVIGALVAPAGMVWSVVLMSQNLRDRKSGSLDSLALIELVLNKLTRLNTGFGWLQPLRVQLIAAVDGKVAYGFHFGVEQPE